MSTSGKALLATNRSELSGAPVTAAHGDLSSCLNQYVFADHSNPQWGSTGTTKKLIREE